MRVLPWSTARASFRQLRPRVRGRAGVAAGAAGLMVLGIVGLLTVPADATTAPAPARSSMVSWGDDSQGEGSIPSAATWGVTSVDGGVGDSLALRSDGTVVAWGNDSFGQADVPFGLSGVTAIAAGDSHDLALKSDGTVVSWGRFDDDGASRVPAGLPYAFAIAAGAFHDLAVTLNGTVVAWGDDRSGETDVPAGLTDVSEIAAGDSFSLALKQDGTVVAWGSDVDGETDVPTGLTRVEAIAAGAHHAVALTADGTVVSWGSDAHGESDVPAGLSGVTAIAAGGDATLALRWDGTVVAWGDDQEGQTDVPRGLTGVTGIAAGDDHALALVTPSPQPQQVLFTSPRPRHVVVGDRYRATVVGGGSRNPVDVSTEGGCTTTAHGRVHFVHATLCVVEALQQGNPRFLSGTAVQIIHVRKAPQDVTIISTPRRLDVGARYHPVARGHRGGPRVRISASGSCTVGFPGIVRLTRPGTCRVVAKQNGTADYRPGKAVQRLRIR